MFHSSKFVMAGLRLAFGCEARTGKSVSCQYLIDRYGGIEKSFASPLYDILHYAQEKCKFPIEKDRRFLQYVGTEWARARNPDVWADLLVSSVREADTSENIYVSDLRFPNEFHSLKKNGFTLIRIIREKAREDQTFGQGSHLHSSETSLLNVPFGSWDHIIVNNSDDVEDLYSQLDSIVEQHKRNHISNMV